MHLPARLSVYMLVALVTVSSWADQGAVVFGSWLNARFAENARVEVSQRLGISARVVRADVQGQRYHRLVSATMAEPDARKLIARSSQLGLSAWYLRQDDVPRVVVPEQQPPALFPDKPPPALFSDKPPPAPFPDKPPPALRTPTQPSPPSAIEPASGVLAEAVPTPMAPITKPLNLTPGEAGAPIVVPFYDTVDIEIDGHVDESIWANAPAYDNMLVMDPDTLDEPSYVTETRFLYTSKGLYVAAIMHQPADTLVARLSSRDKQLNRDSFGITLDTSGEGLYGYWFTVALGGSFLDGKVVPERTFNEQWDGPWLGNSALREDGWSVEMFLPWSMMAMPQRGADRNMGLWVDRKVAHMDERYGWPALPFAGARFMSALQPMRLSGLEPKQQYAVFPYVSATHDEIRGEQEFKAGADVSWRPSSNLQLTATLNPDFGAVESDDVVVNLTAFEVFFPEKRLFFLEGNEVFITSPRSDTRRFQTSPDGTGARKTPSTFIPEPTTLFNTRRIGGPPRQLVVPDGIEVPGVELGKPTDVLGALKVVGQAGGLRYGVLSAAEDDVSLIGLDTSSDEIVEVTGNGRNFGIARVLYESAGVDRKAIGFIGTIVTLPGDDSMTQGIDGHYLSSGGKWKSDTQLLHSNVDATNGYGAFTDLVYTPKTGYIHRLSFDYFDKNLDISDLGFLRQNDAIGFQYGFTRSTGQGLNYFRNVRNAFFISAQTNTDGFLNRMGIFTNQTLLLPNSSQIRFEVDYYPERWDDRNSRGNGMFKTDARWFTQIGFGTDSAKRFSWSGTVGAEQEELNSTWTYASDIGFTYRPIDRFSLDVDL
ncbi:MAG: DUF5916 domain-containing protein [Gammaproteobacteria bacterium]|nr:DUF5916 domain-containing protein [Gammaproteobacteria bacterium]